MKKKWNRNGSVLLIAVFAIALLSTLVAGILQVNTEELMIMKNQIDSVEARAIANAGLNDAFAQLRNDSAWNDGFSSKSFSGGTYSVNVSGNLPELSVVSKAVLDGFSAKVSADVTISGTSPHLIQVTAFRINE